MATRSATRAYRDEHEDAFAEGYFRRLGDAVVSSVGLGTYLGDPTDAVDDDYEAAIRTGLEAGCNVIDTAINYRCQRSERVVGRALERSDVDREAVFVATKGGYLPFDGDHPTDPTAYVTEEYVEPGILDPDDLVAGSHCIDPDYLDDQLDRSLANLGLETIDCYYVHNPATQLRERSREAVYDALEDAFVRLEERADAGDIGCYGVATWQAFRVPSDHPSYLSVPAVLERARTAARTVGAEETRFRAIQLPFNAAMPEAATERAHDGPDGPASVLEYALETDVDVVTSASIAQGSLADGVPSVDRRDDETPVQQAINVARSAPGVTASLVGTSTETHVRENVDAGAFAPLDDEAIGAVLE
ncbi:aldo/keto reductase [Natrialbaceae archaeon AArc-T1-2]|uniref:aldo/keto reductase n=1 Tax=Natrialbaceae archaeon AArc-T1-2 TaxID=3053904 RepID=UPI00255ACA20|nr:aldo/keto reductase [Natrialbaceae archaeon AArc-T1-2]WIV66754.1 aldo/keto reductase [Natrialbaceae archaeon AArc-T1-2]